MNKVTETQPQGGRGIPVARVAAARPWRRRPRTKTGFGRVAMLAGIAPAVILFAVFLGLPILQSLQVSFSRWDGVGSVTWIGWSNYSQLFHGGGLLASLLLTLRYSLFCTALMMAIASVLAAAVHGRSRGSRIYRVMWFLPAIAPGAAVGVFWSLAFQPGQGVVNALLGYLGLGNQHTWLAQPSTAIYPCVVASVWAGVGLAYLLVLGAISSVPGEIYESARLDGASAVRQFFSVTLPLIRPVLVTTAMLEIIWSANGFTLLWAMTQGGPGDSTAILPVLVYRQAFQFGDYGAAAATAVVGGAVLLVIGAVMLRVSRPAGEAAA
jgi:ABC-type sugar transport system permease subunit